jgi:hypothetical protein
VIDISVRTNVANIRSELAAFASQLPFVVATALTATAKKVQVAQTSNLSRVFDRPTPFTQKAVGVKAAKKNDLRAQVFVKDIAAAYLAPYEFGGVHKVNGRAVFVPKAVTLNQYGNLPRSMIARLKGRADIFIGPVKTKRGVINGVWQRPTIVAAGVGKRVAKSANQTGRMKLLIRFSDPTEVKKHLGYRALARQIVSANINRDLTEAAARAIASAR